MIYKFQVVHAEEAKSAAMRDQRKPLYLAEVFAQYSYFCRTFVGHCDSKRDVIASCRADVHTENGLIVTLDSTLDAASALGILASFLTQMNASTPGLCLVIDAKEDESLDD